MMQRNEDGALLSVTSLAELRGPSYCSVCRETFTPSFERDCFPLLDQTGADGEMPLICERCFDQRHLSQATPIVEVHPGGRVTFAAPALSPSPSGTTAHGSAPDDPFGRALKRWFTWLGGITVLSILGFGRGAPELPLLLGGVLAAGASVLMVGRALTFQGTVRERVWPVAAVLAATVAAAAGAIAFGSVPWGEDGDSSDHLGSLAVGDCADVTASPLTRLPSSVEEVECDAPQRTRTAGVTLLGYPTPEPRATPQRLRVVRIVDLKAPQDAVSACRPGEEIFVSADASIELREGKAVRALCMAPR